MYCRFRSNLATFIYSSHFHTHHVLAMGSFIGWPGSISTLDTVKGCRDCAPLRLRNPPIGTREVPVANCSTAARWACKSMHVKKKVG